MESSFWITEERIRRWAERTEIFFVLAIGRSGTKFLAELLNQSSDVCVVHEPVPEDFMAHQKAFHSKEEADRYIHQFRRKDIYLRVREQRVATYGEVNSLLRRHCNALERAFPDATLLHLVRDGRDVVRSMMSRKTMTSEDPNTALIFPTDQDPCRDEWRTMSRFERLCWYWQVENRYLRHNIQRCVRFENLVTDYDYFREKLLSPIGIGLSLEKWQAATRVPKNVTDRYRIPHWTQWDSQTMAAFRRICEEEMAHYGYT
jgi:hypothetical protein